MPDAPSTTPVEYEALAALLKAVASPPRLELLSILRFPRTLAEIELRPHRSDNQEPADRLSARPTVLAHVNHLVETGLVRAETIEWRGRDVPRYTTDASRLYALVEEMRALSTIYAGRGPVADATGTVAMRGAPARVTGPRLTLVHGVYEGKVFALDGPRDDDAGWLIGRRRDLALSLDYDPYVSVEHARIARVGSEHVITDLGSKNGTLVNWTKLPSGGEHPLESGDIVSVGRSLLVFRAR